MTISVPALRKLIWQDARAGSDYVIELDGVRAISILLILATHLLPLGPASWRIDAITGNGGMSLFFALSGFLITTILWHRPEVKPFLMRRIARIVPLYLLYGAILTLVVTWRPDTLAAIATFTLNYRDDLFIDGISHLWSLCIEMHFYLIIAAAIGLFGRAGFLVVPILGLTITGLRIHEEVLVSIRSHLRMDEILSGAMLGLWWSNRGRPLLHRASTALPWLLLPVFVLWLIGCHGSQPVLAYLRPWLTALLIGGILFLPADNRLKRFLSNDVFGYIAQISYALYIWHPLFALGSMSTGSLAVKYLVKRPITFALTFLVSTISTTWFERYFTRLVRRHA